MKKYELLNIRDGKARRIIALRDIPRYNVKAGDLGGWVESEHNLSQDGDCWVGGNARVDCHARVFGNALVFDNAQVYEGALIDGNALVFDNAQVYGHAQVGGNAHVGGDAWVDGSAQVDDNAVVDGNAWVTGRVQVFGDAWVGGSAWLASDARIDGNAVVDGDARVGGDAQVGGSAWVPRRGVITSTQDYLVVGPIGSESDHITFYRTASDIWVRCGWFNGALSAFIKDNRCAQEYIETVNYARSVFERRNQYSHTDNPHA